MSSIQTLVSKIKSGEVSATEVVRGYLAAVAGSRLNSFILDASERVLEAAGAVDKSLAQGNDPGPLAGLPIAVKDVFVTQGMETTAGSRVLKGYIPPYTATAVARLEQAGAIVLGKTNCDEFAMGSSGENSGFGPTKNPWDESRVPGGSSSGSAAALAAGECAASLGSDTGGSIRQPAAFCGVTGLKPTYGRVSRYGLIAMTSSLDCPGPFARSAEDAATLLGVMAGYDERDATSSRQPVPDYVAELQSGVKGMKVGMPQEFFGPGLAPDVRTAVEAAIAKLQSAGAIVTPVSLPAMAYALAAYYVICPSEVSANLARYDGMRFGSRSPEAGDLAAAYRKTRGQLFGAEVKRRIMLGTYALSAGYYDAYYRKAVQARAAICDDFDKVFTQVDVLVTPTTPETAFLLGSKSQDPLAMYLADVYTVPVNIAGLPAISVPCGFSGLLPIGLQFIGQRFQEAKILRAAHAYQSLTDWHNQQPG